MSSSYNYHELGLKAGLEIHQQLDTKEKLFCGCPTIVRDTEESNFEFFRYLRPTRSEMGEVDPAALAEAILKKKFVYKAYDTTCLIENDEEPPRELNREALEITLQIAKLLNMNVFDEIHTMRKIVIDGSNTSGFQRTALASTQGYIETDLNTVGIGVLCLEEEAAQKVEDKGDSVIYSLDRLGIPLVEIGTDPDIITPAHAREVAEQLGMLLRSTGRVKRGLGTIRQDINISIARGERVEIKGVQTLELIETIIEREVQRQVNLLEIMDELKSRKAHVPGNVIDVTNIFNQSRSKVIKKALKNGVVLAVNLPGFAGVVGREVQPGRRLGTEFSDHAKKSGVGGVFHTDELPGYGITDQEVDALKKSVGAETEDCVIMVADHKDRAREALQMVINRARQVLESIPGETRRGLPDGNSAYMRPLPGAARMYPETDVTPVIVTQEMLDSVKLPELLPQRKLRYMTDFGLNEELAARMAYSTYFTLFEEIISKVQGIHPILVASTLIHTLPELRREGVDVGQLQDYDYVQIFNLINSGNAAKEALPDILRTLSQHPKTTAHEAAASLGLKGMDIESVEHVVDEIIAQRQDFISQRGLRAVGPLMGVVMKELRGSVDGKIISNILKKKIQEQMGSAS
jgi:glutamyl-tRNA(Gln) amidotransferase subunit E